MKVSTFPKRKRPHLVLRVAAFLNMIGKTLPRHVKLLRNKMAHGTDGFGMDTIQLSGMGQLEQNRNDLSSTQ
jgi:hypothetical protein